MNNEDQISLRHYIEAISEERWNAHKREHELLTLAMEKAVQATDRRLEGMNELRAQINSERSSYATKAELRPVVQFIDRFWGIIAGVLVLNGLITTLFVLLLRKAQ